MREVLEKLKKSKKHRALYCALTFAARPAHVRELYGQISTREERESLVQEKKRVTEDLTRAVRAASTLFDMADYSDEKLIAQAERSFGGRLTLKRTSKGMETSYCAGQFYPLEFREAVACVLEDLLAALRRNAMLKVKITGTPSAELWRQVGASNGYNGFDKASRKAWGTRFVTGFYRLPIPAGTFVFVTQEKDETSAHYVIRLGSDDGCIRHPLELWPEVTPEQREVLDFGKWPCAEYSLCEVVDAVVWFLKQRPLLDRLDRDEVLAALLDNGEEPCAT